MKFLLSSFLPLFAFNEHFLAKKYMPSYSKGDFMNDLTPTTFHFDTQKDKEYGSSLKFHHVFHSYREYHSHDFFEFIICFQGAYKHIVNGKDYPMGKLDSAMLYPSDSHSLIEKKEDACHYCISVREEKFRSLALSIDPSFFKRFKEGDYHPFSLSEARLKRIVYFLSLIKEKEGNIYEQEPLVSYLLFNLFEPLFIQHESISENNRPAWLSELLIEINKPDNLHWNVDDVTQKTNYSKTHLSRIFKQYVGTSIGEYLQEVKLSNARDILINSDMSITELCDIIGHSSLSHFSSVFKKRYGLAPGKYKEKYKRKE